MIVHQMTGISVAHAGKPDLKHFVAQAYANRNGLGEGGWVKTEEDSLDLHEGTAAHTRA